MNDTEITLNKALELQLSESATKTFITYKDTNYNYEEINDLINCLVTTLKDSGVKQGDSICLLLPRIPELIITFLAATKIGAYPAPTNYLLSSSDIKYFIEQVSPKAIIACSRLLSSDILSYLDTKDTLLLIDTENIKENWLTWDTAIASKPDTTLTTVTPTDIAYLNFTTGTSGHPKGALTTHSNIYWNTRSAMESFEMCPKDIHLCMFASFAHPHELFARALYTGASLVLLEEINPKTIINTINKYSITCMMGLAPMYEMMANRCTSMSIPSLRIAESGGMFTRSAVNKNFQQQFGIPILSVWGSTETTGVALANTESDFTTNGSTGKVCPYYQVKLVDENTTEVPVGEAGELLFKGPGIVAGYDKYNDPFLDNNGWYASGDIARVDKDGFYYFIERKNGMIKVAGLQVYPLQVELVLLEHPKIAEIAILGIPDRRKGNVPMAFITTENDEYLKIEDIITFCKGKIPSYMTPKQFKFMESLPKIGSGKINKKALAKLLPLC